MKIACVFPGAPVADGSKRRSRKLIRRNAGWLILGFTLVPLLAQDPRFPPGVNFDLSHWRLTLPDALATDIFPDELNAGFTNEYFQTGRDGAMVFRCPVTGGTTGGSDFPRCELREMLDPRDNDVNWSGHGRHVLKARCRVLKVTDSKRLIIGQIHAYLGDAPPLLKIQYTNGAVDALVKLSTGLTNDTRLNFGQVGLSNSINYEINFTDGLLRITINGISRSVNLGQSDPGWLDQEYYFKAGNYLQDNTGGTNEYSMVAFYELSTEHQPPCFITNATVGNSSICLTWRALPGSTYYVQGAVDPASPNWSTLSPTITATGYSASFCMPLPSFYRFFRVGVQVPPTPLGNESAWQPSDREREVP
jgi:hypothetical protein